MIWIFVRYHSNIKGTHESGMSEYVNRGSWPNRNVLCGCESCWPHDGANELKMEEEPVIIPREQIFHDSIGWWLCTSIRVMRRSAIRRKRKKNMQLLYIFLASPFLYRLCGLANSNHQTTLQDTETKLMLWNYCVVNCDKLSIMLCRKAIHVDL